MTLAPLKVAHITTVDTSLTKLILTQLRRLRAQGHQVTGISAAGPEVPALEAAGIRHLPIPMTRRITPLADWQALWQLYHCLRRERFVLVHTHTPKANLLGQWAAWLARTPVRVMTVHGLYFTPQTPRVKRLLFQWLERLSMSWADVVFLINEDDVHTVRELRLCAPDRIRLLPAGVGIEIDRFSHALVDPAVVNRKRAELGLAPEALVIGYVGRLVREKGLLDLMEAFRQLSPRVPEARLLVVGPHDAEKADALSPETAQQLGIAERCVFAGMRHDTADLYALMDVFVLPSYREGRPLSTMEAQAMGVPVVTTEARGCHDSILPGQTGLVVPMRDPGALAASLLTLCEDAGLRQRMGAAGRRLAVERFDERLVFEMLEQEYDRLLRLKGCVPRSGTRLMSGELPSE